MPECTGHLNITHIKKRDGRLVEFDLSKIAAAIEKAFAATYKPGNREMADQLAGEVRTLLEVEGVGEKTASLLKLMPDMARVYYAARQDGAYIRSNKDAQELLLPRLMGRREELVYVLLLDAKGKCLAVELVHEGSVNASEVNLRKIAALAIRANAAGLILAHNHPGGVSTPSQEDVLTTRHMQTTLEAMEIQLVDHLVFADRSFTSMRQTGLL